MHSTSFLKLAAGVTLGVAVLSGCATSFVVDNTVQSFSGLTALPVPATYRFERLPSQQDPAQARVEALADTALNSAGLRRDDANARYTAQVSGRIQRAASPWADPWDGWYGGGGFGWGRRGGRFGLGFGSMTESPWYHREAVVILRDAATHRVVFESHAVHDGPWQENSAVFPAMFQAALQGFPQAPAGPRRVDITVGR